MARVTQKDGEWWVEDSQGLRRATDAEVKITEWLASSVAGIDELLEQLIERNERFEQQAEALSAYRLVLGRLVEALDEALEITNSDVPEGHPPIRYKLGRELVELHTLGHQLSESDESAEFIENLRKIIG